MILRYEPIVDSTPGGAHARMAQRPDGEWVKYAEVVTLEARVAVLEEEVALALERFNGD